MLFANEYLRADNPAAFHTECNCSLRLIELRTCARVEDRNKQTKKRFGGTRSILFGLRDQENEVFFSPHCETDIGGDSEESGCILIEKRSDEERRKKKTSHRTLFSTQWKLSVQAMLNITVECSCNFNLCSLIVHVNVTQQERQNLLLAES